MTNIEDSPCPADIESDYQSGLSKKQLKKFFLTNVISNAVFFIFNAVTSLMMVPYQISHLGIACFGMIVLAGSFVAYTQILTVALINAVFRYVTERLAQNDLAGAKQYFSTQAIAVMAFIIIFLPISAVISYYTPAFLKIPHGQATNTRWLFFCVYLSFLISLSYNPFTMAQHVKQRFDLRNYIEIASQLVRYSVWIVLFSLLSPSMWHIGVGYILGALVSLIGTYVAFRKLMPGFGIDRRSFDFVKFAEMLKMSTWLVVTQVGFILYLGVDILIINTMIGPTSSGKYATILGLAIMLRGVSSMMTGMITPVAIATYARGEIKSLIDILERSVKFVSIGMAIPIGCLCGLAIPFLTWWIGPRYAALYPLVWLLLAHHIINCGVQPLFNVNVAANKTAMPGISTLAGGVIKLVATILLVRYTSLGIYAVAIAAIIGFASNNWIFTPIYAARILKISSWPFYRALLPSGLVFALTAALALQCSRSINLTSFIRISAAGIMLIAVASALTYLLLLNRDDRSFLKKLIRRG